MIFIIMKLAQARPGKRWFLVDNNVRTGQKCPQMARRRLFQGRGFPIPAFVQAPGAMTFSGISP